MIKNKIALEINKDCRNYSFVLDVNCPLGEIYDVLGEMKNFILNKMAELEKMASDVDKKPDETQE